MKRLYTIFGQTYGSGAYSSCTYNTCSTSGTGTSGSSGSNGATLTNTGFDIALIVTLACILAFIALVVRLWRKSSIRKVAVEPVLTDDDQTNVVNSQDK